MKLKEISNVVNAEQQLNNWCRTTSWNNIRYSCYDILYNNNDIAYIFQSKLIRHQVFFSIMIRSEIGEIINEIKRSK
jgi:hypothetical protein